MPERLGSRFDFGLANTVVNQAKNVVHGVLGEVQRVTHTVHQFMYAHPVLSTTLISVALFEMIEAAAPLRASYEAERISADITGDMPSRCHRRDYALPQCDTYAIYQVIAWMGIRLEYLGQLYNQWAGSRFIYDENSACIASPCYPDLEMTRMYASCIQAVMVNTLLNVLNNSVAPIFRNSSMPDCVVTIPDWQVAQNNGQLSYRVLVSALQIVSPGVDDNLCDAYAAQMLVQANACKVQELATKDDTDPKKYLPLLALLGILPIIAGIVIYYRRTQQAQSAIDAGTSTATRAIQVDLSEDQATQTAIVIVPPRPTVMSDVIRPGTPREIIFRQPPVTRELETRVVTEASCCGFCPDQSTQEVTRERVTVERTVTIMAQMPEWGERPTVFIEPVGESDPDQLMYHQAPRLQRHVYRHGY